MLFDEFAKKILQVEKGLVDNPKDPGGLTNCGISARAHPELSREDIINMTPERAAAIYHTTYWLPIKGDDLEIISPRLAHAVLDMAVNSGPAQAVKTLQRSFEDLGKPIKPDGVLGPATLELLRTFDSEALCKAYLAARLIFMSDLPNWGDSKNGWIRRVLSL